MSELMERLNKRKAAHDALIERLLKIHSHEVFMPSDDIEDALTMVIGAFTISIPEEDASEIGVPLKDMYPMITSIVEKDYSPVLKALEKADIEFTEKHGCGTHYSEFDEHLKSAVTKYNSEHGTDFQPFEALHQYLEKKEAEPFVMPMQEIEVSVDDLEVESNPNRSIH